MTTDLIKRPERELAKCGCGAPITSLQSPAGEPWKWTATCENHHGNLIPNDQIDRVLSGFQSFAALRAKDTGNG